jgi:dienelactone hydrolase
MFTRHRHAPALLALILAAGLAACGGSAEPDASTAEPASTAAATVDPELSRLATEFIDQLVAGDFAAAAASFDATMAEALPAADLASTWQQLGGQVGAYEQEISRRQESTGGYDAVIVTAQFERSPLDIRIVFDSERRIAGLFFQPASTTASEATAEAWVSPSYAGDHENREVTVGELDLPGTLTTPVGAGPWPAVVLVHGSGPNDRDESIGPNKPFRDLALGLASEGIAVLTYDKRTLVHPEELPADLTVAEEVVDDAVAAVALLRAAPEVDPGRVFVLGHSLGGMLAPRVAGASDGVAGLVLMAAPARPLEELILEQTTYLAETDGTVTAEEEDALADVAAQVEAVRDLGPGTAAGEVLGAPASYWLDLRDYRPAEVAAGLDLPMLVLQGERDYQVTMTDFGMWQEALAGAEDVAFRSFPELNHLMMTGEGDGEAAAHGDGAGLSGPEEYEVAGHVAQEVVEAIAAFILGED